MLPDHPSNVCCMGDTALTAKYSCSPLFFFCWWDTLYGFTCSLSDQLLLPISLTGKKPLGGKSARAYRLFSLIANTAHPFLGPQDPPERPLSWLLQSSTHVMSETSGMTALMSGMMLHLWVASLIHNTQIPDGETYFWVEDSFPHSVKKWIMPLFMFKSRQYWLHIYTAHLRVIVYNVSKREDIFGPSFLVLRSKKYIFRPNFPWQLGIKQSCCSKNL